MISLAEIRDAYERIRDHVIHTPLVPSASLSRIIGSPVYLKLETMQEGGSFKIRGAMNRILRHLEQNSTTRVVAASAGNHAQGVAIAARIAGIPAVIVMPEWSSISKQEAVRAYGAEVIIFGRTIEESAKKAEEISKNSGLFIHPYNDEQVIAGQGTLALEVFSDLPSCNLIIVPVGGGGLIAGTAVAAKAIRPSCRIIGVQTSSCSSLSAACLRGEPVSVQADHTIADGIRITRTGSLTFPIITKYMDEIVTVSDDEIAHAMLWLVEYKKIVSEGAGAVSVAALLSGKCSIPPGCQTVPIISGGNVDTHQLFRILRRALIFQGRILQISVIIDDIPGSLARLLTIIGTCGGNILHIHHNSPGKPDIPVHQIRVDIELETRGLDHSITIKENLLREGYKLG